MCGITFEWTCIFKGPVPLALDISWTSDCFSRHARQWPPLISTVHQILNFSTTFLNIMNVGTIGYLITSHLNGNSHSCLLPNLNEWLNKRGKLKIYHLILIIFVTSIYVCINHQLICILCFGGYKLGGEHWVGRFSSAQGLATGIILYSWIEDLQDQDKY